MRTRQEFGTKWLMRCEENGELASNTVRCERRRSLPGSPAAHLRWPGLAAKGLRLQVLHDQGSGVSCGGSAATVIMVCLP